MASSAKIVESWSLPPTFPEDQIPHLLETFTAELRSSLDLDLKYAAAIRNITSHQRRRVQELQKQHFRYLLSASLDELEWRNAAQALGKELARYGIPLQWVSESYRLFARYMAAHAASLQPGNAEFREFCSRLNDRLFRDISLQSVFYDDSIGPERFAELPAQIDHLLLTSPTVEELYSRLMDFLMQIDGIAGAWLGHPDEQGVVHPKASGGAMTAEYLSGAPVYLLDNLDSPLARAWITGETQCIADWADLREIGDLSFWRERGLHFGWRSSCAIPIIHGSTQQRDALLLYSKEVNFFARPEIRQMIVHLQGVLGVTIERLRLMETLEEQRQTLTIYRTGMDASRNGILIADALDPEQPIQYVNPAFEEITGYPAQEALGRNCLFLQGKDTAQPELETVREALRKGEPCSVEVRNYRQDGSMFWNALSIAPVRNDTGLVTHFIGVQNDVTRLKTSIGENSRSTGLYRALMSAAELIIRAQNERELLDEMCRLMVDSELFSQVWVARPNIAGDLEIESIFSTVQLKQYRYLPNVYTGDEGRVLAVRAWRQSKLQYTNDRLADPDAPAIQNFYREHDLHATAVVPLYRDGDMWALLTLISHERNIFTPELLELLERIGRLIGHGLDALDLRQILEEERQHQSWLARHDALTDVLNRRGVIERLDEALSRARRHKKMMAVAVLDLDGFKALNDVHGHPAGDLLLRTVADRLQSTLRQTDAVGRLGSDEFVLIIEDLDHEDDLTMMLNRIQAAIEVPVYLASGRSITLRSSTGVTLFPSDDSAPERLLRHADRALYAFKESKDDPAQRWMLFQAEVDEQKIVRQKTILALFRAGNVRVHYQPVIDLQTGKISGIEALARLANHDNSLLPPADFIPQLSATDLGVLTHQVMEQSIRDLQRLDKAGFVLNIGINLEPVTLADPKAVQDLRDQMESSGLEASRFIFELLERADTLSMAGSQKALYELKATGARIALDDVGSAYSSLLRVKELPVDVVKLDRSFLIGLELQPNQLRFMMHLVHLVQGLGPDLVVEGVECDATGDALAALGVHLAQGYAIARPMGIEDLLKWMKRQKPVEWTSPTSVLGAVALQLSGLDATARVLQQRPGFLHYMFDRDPDSECEIGTHLHRLGPVADRATAAHRAWHTTMARLSSHPGGAVDPPAFQAARTSYEDELFEAALEAHRPVQ
jgi:diguanylate cyclase (GGDEF)-like protein/PAS domain S-box-containing protein